MALRFTCPNCHRELEVPDEAAGTAGTCQFCRAAIVAPSAPDQPAALAQTRGEPPPDAPTGAPVAQVPYGRIEPFNILSESWRLVWDNFGPIAISTYIPLIIVVAGVMAVGIPFGLYTKQTVDLMSLAGSILDIVLFLALSPLLAAPLYAVDDILTRGQADMSVIFRGYQRYQAFIVFNLFYYALPNLLILLLGYALVGMGGAGQVLSALANVVLTAFIYATIYPGVMEIVDRGTDGMTAVKASWDFTKGHRWMILLTWIVVSFAAMAGIIVFCLGVLVTALLWSPAVVLIYRDIRGLRGNAPTLITGPAPGARTQRGTPWALISMAGCGVLVIPILAAILFPVFAKAREKAKIASCLNGVKQQELALMQYASDHDNRLPPANRWEDAIATYLPKDTPGCPDAKSGVGYVFNAAMGGQPMPTGAAAATTVLIFDGGNGGRNQSGKFTTAVARHGNSVTVGYADGHVTMVPRGGLAGLSWSPPN